jgi:hypothetical protein
MNSAIGPHKPTQCIAINVPDHPLPTSPSTQYFDFDPDFDDLRRGNPEISRGAFTRTGARPPLPRAATARALSALPLSSPWLGVSGPFGKSHPTRPVKALYPTLLTLFEPISALMTFPLGPPRSVKGKGQSKIFAGSSGPSRARTPCGRATLLEGPEAGATPPSSRSGPCKD